jgi:hypothetical protein
MKKEDLTININKIVFFGFTFDAPITAEELWKQFKLKLELEVWKIAKKTLLKNKKPH